MKFSRWFVDLFYLLVISLMPVTGLVIILLACHAVKLADTTDNVLLSVQQQSQCPTVQSSAPGKQLCIVFHSHVAQTRTKVCVMKVLSLTVLVCQISDHIFLLQCWLRRLTVS